MYLDFLNWSYYQPHCLLRRGGRQSWFEEDGLTGKFKCDECGRFHYHKCWGRDYSRSPYHMGTQPAVAHISDTDVVTDSVNDKKSVNICGKDLNWNWNQM